MTYRVLLALTLLTLPAFGQLMAEIPVMPYDSLMEDRVGIDGTVEVEEDEYPASFTSPATGITVYWGFDDSMLYVALTGKGRGWMAVGFGSPLMHEANMILGFYSDDSASVVNHVGQSYGHAEPPDSVERLDEGEIEYDEDTGFLTMEFCYPLRWRGLKGAAVPGLEPGDTYDLILARSSKSASLDQKHGQKAQLKFRLATNPKLKTGE